MNWRIHRIVSPQNLGGTFLEVTSAVIATPEALGGSLLEPCMVLVACRKRSQHGRSTRPLIGEALGLASVLGCQLSFLNATVFGRPNRNASPIEGLQL